MNSYASIFQRLDEAEQLFCPPALPPLMPPLNELSSSDFIPASKLTQPQADLLDAIKRRDYSKARSILSVAATPDLISFGLRLAAVTPSATEFEMRGAISLFLGKLTTAAISEVQQGEGDVFAANLLEWARTSDPRFSTKLREYRGYRKQGTGIEGDIKLPAWLRKARAMPSLVEIPTKVYSGGRTLHLGAFYFSFTTEGSLDFLFVREDARYAEGTPERIGYAVMVSLIPPPTFSRAVSSIVRGIGEFFRSIGRGVLKLGAAAKSLPGVVAKAGPIRKAVADFRRAVGRFRRSRNESHAPLTPLLISCLREHGLTLEDLWVDPSILPLLPEGLEAQLFSLREGYYLAQALDQ